ncbi:SDR family NAD(P)-dependent oxidoreductase [Oryzicola mucosus]|uniref:SDR family oxidoreductase n=1 Tax=Oryzicola mucosus TaxID=2767425 RepID=A0A8J6PR04_9HYPH|nr:SDR family NAD(P)-dependent oxidoreductase [Oryzicola mucosus]MBD0413489.1 SDR family oxidoreductase [Oryzicola mucosus]
MFDDLKGKRVLVTGASSGFGKHFAGLFAGYGASVTLAARRLDALEQSCAEIRDAGGQAEAAVLDVASADSVAALFGALSAPFDIVVNNAGISGTGRALDLTEADWDQVVDVNLKGAFLVAQGAARALKAAGKGGAIVNVASIVGLRVASELAPYAASKAGLIHLTKELALEWARHDIRVNALCPGYIETDINRDFFVTPPGEAMIKRIPQRRLGKIEDLDGAMLLLASQAGAYITGASLAVDGGHLVSSL